MTKSREDELIARMIKLLEDLLPPDRSPVDAGLRCERMIVEGRAHALALIAGTFADRKTVDPRFKKPMKRRFTPATPQETLQDLLKVADALRNGSDEAVRTSLDDLRNPGVTALVAESVDINLSTTATKDRVARAIKKHRTSMTRSAAALSKRPRSSSKRLGRPSDSRMLVLAGYARQTFEMLTGKPATTSKLDPFLSFLGNIFKATGASQGSCLHYANIAVNQPQGKASQVFPA